jgi:hypothetical protein
LWAAEIFFSAGKVARERGRAVSELFETTAEDVSLEHVANLSDLNTIGRPNLY